jgi:transposase-like protein
MSNPRHRYPQEFKKTVISQLERAPVAEVAKAHGLSPSVLHRWWRQIGNHHAKPSPGRRTYAKEFKEAAVQQLESGRALLEVAAGCKVGPTLLRRWLAEFREYGERAFSGYGNSRAVNTSASISVRLRFTEDEYRRLKMAWLPAGNATVSDFVRDQTFKAAAILPPSVAALEGSARELAATLRRLATLS